MKKFRLLLLDANIVIQLFELGLWDQIVERCEILLSRTVAEHEAKYFSGATGDQLIDLTKDIEEGRIALVDKDALEVKQFLDQFDPVYLGEMDPGEAESLAYIFSSRDTCLISSSDAIVFRVLGRLNCEEQGVSLEEILHECGFACTLPRQYGKAFRDQWTKRGQEEMVRGIGLVK